FKFMLEDEEVAKSFLSAIIEEEVLEVHFAAQERTLRRPLIKLPKRKMISWKNFKPKNELSPNKAKRLKQKTKRLKKTKKHLKKKTS
ncbi:MAG: hypothetical protein LBL62_09995, partial [Planctomycetaceae bacterium]|nr:hypothetical protein [Planctomycetaceae bacterium]